VKKILPEEALAYHSRGRKGKIEVAVLYRGVSEAVAKQLAVTDLEDQELVKKTLPR